MLGTPVFAGVVHAAAVTEGFEEAAVAGVTGVAAGQLVAQAGLLMGDTAAGGARASPLQLHCISHVLWVLKRRHKALSADLQIPDAKRRLGWCKALLLDWPAVETCSLEW